MLDIIPGTEQMTTLVWEIFGIIPCRSGRGENSAVFPEYLSVLG